MTTAHHVIIKKKEEELHGEVIEIDEDKLLDISKMNSDRLGIGGPTIAITPNYSGVCIRSGGILRGKSLFLPPEYNWVISKDPNGHDLLLIPYKK